MESSYSYENNGYYEGSNDAGAYHLSVFLLLFVVGSYAATLIKS